MYQVDEGAATVKPARHHHKRADARATASRLAREACSPTSSPVWPIFLSGCAGGSFAPAPSAVFPRPLGAWGRFGRGVFAPSLRSVVPPRSRWVWPVPLLVARSCAPFFAPLRPPLGVGGGLGARRVFLRGAVVRRSSLLSWVFLPPRRLRAVVPSRSAVPRVRGSACRVGSPQKNLVAGARGGCPAFFGAVLFWVRRVFRFFPRGLPSTEPRTGSDARWRGVRRKVLPHFPPAPIAPAGGYRGARG